MMHAPLVGPYLLGKHQALAGRGSIFRLRIAKFAAMRQEFVDHVFS
jgi:hypothetical protein